jgi:hypothetical protein
MLRQRQRTALPAYAFEIDDDEYDLAVEFEPLPVGVKAVYVEIRKHRTVFLNENEPIAELIEVMANLPRGVNCTIL